jgi:hypothetical protein
MNPVTKDQRALLVVANLTTWADDRYGRLYEWLDQNAVRVAKALLRLLYRQINALTGASATREHFVQSVTEMALDPHTRALDVFLHLHGQPGRLFFEEGPVETSDLADELAAARLGQRLRLLYSTACYGASHAPDFVKAGFRVASGSVGANANGPYDYPVQLLRWGLGQTYRMVASAGNQPAFMATLDNLARTLGFDDISSHKVVHGRVQTRITTEAD